MKTIIASLFAASMAIMSVPAQADVFSSQGFSGEESTLNALPGVNLDLGVGGGVAAGNCVEVDTPSFAGRRNMMGSKSTECSFGNNFTITTTQSSGMRSHFNNVYGDNPPPWAERWRP